MAAVVTVAERRQLEVERVRAAGDAVIADLRAYAAVNGVRFRVFGSFARGDLVSTSDFDVVVDAPEERLRGHATPPRRPANSMACTPTCISQ